MFDVLRQSCERFVHFELSTTLTTMFTKPYRTANWNSRINEQVETSTASMSHSLRKILARRHYFPKTYTFTFFTQEREKIPNCSWRNRGKIITDKTAILLLSVCHLLLHDNIWALAVLCLINFKRQINFSWSLVLDENQSLAEQQPLSIPRQINERRALAELY
jgi:hypothetical protein